MGGGANEGLPPLAAGTVAILSTAGDRPQALQPTLKIEAGVRWRWTDARARERDDRVRCALTELAGRLAR